MTRRLGRARGAVPAAAGGHGAARRAATSLASLLVLAFIACSGTQGLQEHPRSGLRARHVGTGQRPIVLLHGYSSSPDEWLPFTTTITLPAGWRFVFPEGPGRGTSGRGRAWWPLDLASHQGSDGLPDLSRTRPEGLAIAAVAVRTLLDELHENTAGSTPILGGFSQGGMVSAEVAFRSDTPLAALVLLSPTVVDEASWAAGIRRRKGLRVFLSHGRRDDVLPFEASARLAGTLRGADLDVTWVPFDGGHDIPAQVVVALNGFLQRVP